MIDKAKIMHDLVGPLPAWQHPEAVPRIKTGCRISSLPGNWKRFNTYASCVPMMMAPIGTQTITITEFTNALPMFARWNASTKLSKLRPVLRQCHNIRRLITLSSVLNAVMTQEIMGNLTATKEKTSDIFKNDPDNGPPAEYCFLRFFIYIAPFAAFFAALLFVIVSTAFSLPGHDFIVPIRIGGITYLKNSFCKIVHAKMIRSNTTAIADASPTFWLVCAILFMLIKYVAVPLEPPVITNGCSNALSAPVMDKIAIQRHNRLDARQYDMYKLLKFICTVQPRPSYISESTDMIVR